MGQLYLDGVPSWTAGGPINFGDYLPTNIRGLARALFRGEVKAMSIPTLAGSFVNEGVNGGSVANNIGSNMQLRATTATAPNSTIVSYCTVNGLNTHSARFDYIDWDKDILVAFNLARSTSNATAEAFIQLKTSNAIGELGALGIEFRIANLTLYGNAYGTSLGTEVDLGQALTNTYPAQLAMFLNASGVEWFFNNVSKGTLTTANKFPTGMGVATAYLVASLDNGGTATQVDMYVGNIWIVQEV